MLWVVLLGFCSGAPPLMPLRRVVRRPVAVDLTHLVDVVITRHDCDDSRDVASGDLDGDGLQDLVMPCKARSEVSVAFGDGSGGFGTAAGLRSTVLEGDSRSRLPRAVDVGDVDGDSLLDVVVGYSVAGVSLFLNRGSENGSVPEFEHSTAKAPGMLNAVRLVDVDGDGDLDVLWVAQELNGVGWLENPTWAQRTVEVAGAAPKKLHSVLAADLDADGAVELVLLDNYLPPTQLARLSDAARGPAARAALEPRWHTGARDACAADVDGDGFVDVVVAHKTSDEVSWYRNCGRFANGTTNFSLASTPVCASGSCGFACSVACGDFDGDGKVDVAVAEKNENRVSLFLQRTCEERNASRRAWQRVKLVENAQGLADVGVLRPLRLSDRDSRGRGGETRAATGRRDGATGGASLDHRRRLLLEEAREAAASFSEPSAASRGSAREARRRQANARQVDALAFGSRGSLKGFPRHSTRRDTLRQVDHGAFGAILLKRAFPELARLAAQPDSPCAVDEPPPKKKSRRTKAPPAR